MNTIYNIRKINLLKLSRDFELIKDFCAKVNIFPAQFSQITKGKKNLGFLLARRIEEKLKIMPGYMDINHDEIKSQAIPKNEAILSEALKIILANKQSNNGRIKHNRRSSDEESDSRTMNGVT
jgi:transcriptional regulator with XRE-family HTH domain